MSNAQQMPYRLRLRLCFASLAMVFATVICAGTTRVVAQSSASTGPDGARIDIVKRAEVFGLDGVAGDQPIHIGQYEWGEPRATHDMLKGFVIRRSPDINYNADKRNHATSVAAIMVGRKPNGRNLLGIAHGANLWSAGSSHNGVDKQFVKGQAMAGFFQNFPTVGKVYLPGGLIQGY